MDKEQHSPERLAELQLASHFGRKFKEAMIAKSKYTRQWHTYFDAYRGDYFKKKNIPSYKSNVVSNYIFSIIETIRPIMLDNDPKFQAMPRQAEGLKLAEHINMALMYEWDRERMNSKLYRELINGLVTGNYFFFVPYNKVEKNVNAIPVSPFNIFPDPLAKDIDSAEYIIYADYYNAETLKRKYPSRAQELTGGKVNYQELVNDNHSVSGSEENQILVLECYSRDHITEYVNGEPVVKFPKGRVTTVAPELGIVLSDRANPYEDGRFPFIQGKDYDIPGQFWGVGEVEQLLSPQSLINELNNTVLDNAKATANMPWIIDRNAGIKEGTITNQPGLIVRKNPGSEVRRDQPPSIPPYVQNAITEAKHDMEQISGIFDSLKGNSETGVYTAQGILALQEAGQARIRLKVKLMEDALGRLGELWFSRMRQFWTENKFIAMTGQDGTMDGYFIPKKSLDQDYDIKIMAGSTMATNRMAMLDLMIRLAQTQMSDGQTLVDREAVVEFLPQEVKTSLLSRSQASANAFQGQMDELSQAMQQMQQQSQQFQQEMGQTIQQLTQEMQKNDQQTMQAIEGIVSTLDGVNKKIVQLEQYVDEKEKATAEEQKTSELYDNAYNEGYRDAETFAKQQAEAPIDGEDDVLGEGLPEGFTGDEFSEGEADMEMPDEMLEGLESLSDDELALLQMADPSVNELV